ncbi:MAG: AMP-binding protein [Alicyclobacillus sp.]|nr:AMP-binding protein [Alicyclobacillus sp.]
MVPYLDRFDEVVRSTPEKPAVVDLNTETPVVLRYDELDGLADRVATRLVELGVRPGEAVAYQLPSSWAFIALTLGIWRAGGVACPLLPSLREREVRFILESSGSRLLVVPETFRNFAYRPLAETVAAAVPQEVSVFVLTDADLAAGTSTLGGLMAPQADRAVLEARRPNPDATAQLLYTSGTTGEPKGVLHTFRTLSHALASHRGALGLTAEDTVWVPSPLAHQTGFLYGMMVSHYNGSTGVYQAIWSVDTARRAIVQHGARFVQAAMPFLADITRSDAPPVGLRIFVVTGAAVPRQLAEAARAALRCAVLGAWGSTECCLVTVGRPEDPPEKQWGTDGRAIDGMAVRIVDDEGRVLPPGMEGNFQVKTPAMFPTYLHHHEWYLASLADDGFFDTGDLAVMDEAGYVRLTGRKKDVINRGGEKIPSAEIEDLLYRHPAIQDVAVAAMPDERLGERACAFVVAKPGHQVPELAEVCDFLGAQGMAKIYWPERIEPMDELPRTPSGKVQKFILRQYIADKLQAGED